MYFIAGLILITLAWIIQFYKTVVQKNKNINLYFMVMYVIGVLFLIIGNFLAKDILSGFLNLVSAVLPLLILITVIKN